MAGIFGKEREEEAGASSMRSAADGPPPPAMRTIDGTNDSDFLEGTSGSDMFLDSGGEDTYAGGDGHDYYVVNSVGDLILEKDSEGLDFVIAYCDYTLSDNIEDIELFGDANNAIGNRQDNTITGNNNNNMLDGADGVDYLYGYSGNDTMIVNSPFDQIIERYNEGTDLIIASCNYALRSNVENLQLSAGDATQAIGNALNNALTGNSNNNYIDGAAGADTMSGGAGNDYYIVDDVGDRVIEVADEGTDYVITTASFALGDNVENLSLGGTANVNATGNALANRLFGNDGANVLNGEGGDDVMYGQGGDDTFVVDSASDVVIELADGGYDTVETSVDLTLAENVEKLFYLTGGITLKGNSLNNVITTGSWIATQQLSNVIDGGAGSDDMLGGQGSDTYYVDDSFDKVFELVNDTGVDVVYVSCNFQLGEHGAGVEELVLTGTGNFLVVGGVLGNRITGNDGNNYIDGSAGADVMIGGGGDDSYIVDESLDQVVEDAGKGRDAVTSGVDYRIGENIEVLNLTGLAYQGFGNTLDNQIIGSISRNYIDGGIGSDDMRGGFGDDTYVVDNYFDQIIEYIDQGKDLVQSSVSYTLGQNVEDLTLTGTAAKGVGNELNNRIVGNEENNFIDAGIGADGMLGGLGDDTYVVDNSYDQIVEFANQGYDSVLANTNYTIAANVEKLTLLTGALIGNGNDLDNRIVGNSGNNFIDGGAGADGMLGGLGDDFYYVDNSFDQIAEFVDQGNDIVLASASYALGENIETLFLAIGFQGFGNASDNLISGNSGSNYIDGKGGADTLYGGLGLDFFVFGINEAFGDTIGDFNAAQDVIIFRNFGPGAFVENFDEDTWIIHYAGGVSSETIHFHAATEVATAQILWQ